MPDQTPTPGSGVLDKLAAKAKQAVGHLAGNDTLAEEGELQEQKVERAKEAARLEAEATQAEREAQVAAEQKENRVEQARVQAELAERATAEQVEREERAAAAAIEQDAARKEATIAQQEAATESALDRQETQVVAERIDATQDAAELEREARQAEQTAEVLDGAQRNIAQQTTEG